MFAKPCCIWFSILATLLTISTATLLITAAHAAAPTTHDSAASREGSRDDKQTAAGARELPRLTGRIVYDGAPPKPKPTPIPSSRGHRDNVGRRAVVPDAERFQKLGLKEESLIVGDDRGIANVIVWLSSKNVPAPPRREPFSTATIRFVDGRFDPHVLACWNAAPLKLVNDSADGTNFRWVATFNPYNKFLKAGESFEIPSAKSERLPAALKSDVYPWLLGYIFPLPHPYFAVTDRDGRFEIKNLPLGAWEFALWHERTGWLATKRFPKGRFPYDLHDGENALGDLHVDPATLEPKNARRPTEPSAARGVAPIDELDDYGSSQLHRAAEAGDVTGIRKLLTAGADVDVRQRTYGGTPLQYAASSGHVETVKTLIEHGAIVDTQDAYGRTPLMWAAMEGRAEVVRGLLDSGANIQATNPGGWTPLHYAVKYGHDEAAQLLIDRGADIRAITSQGKTPTDLNPTLHLRVSSSALPSSSHTAAESSAMRVDRQLPADQPGPRADVVREPERKPSDVVAEIQGQPIHWQDITPSPEWHAKRAEYERKYGHTLGYEKPQDYPVNRLKERIFKPLITQYRTNNDTEPTVEEIDRFIVYERRSREHKNKKTEAELAELREQLEKDRKQLESKDLTEWARLALKRKISQEDFHATALQTSMRPPEDERKFAKWYLSNWKLQQSLYKKHGGRVIGQQVGPEALDAMRDLLKEKEREGSFKILDPVLSDRFWEYWVNDRMHTFISTRIFDKQWWQFEEADETNEQ